MNKTILIALTFTLFTSCRMADIAVQPGFYETWNGDNQLIRNDSLGLLFTYKQYEKLIFADPLVKLDSAPTQYGRDILREVGFNRKTDTLYFSNSWTYCFISEQIDLGKFSHEITDQGMWPRDENDPLLKIPHILQRVLVNRHQKRIIIHHIFSFRNRYLSFVYVQQSITKKNKNTEPRQWSHNFDVTDKSEIIFIGMEMNKYIECTRRNSFLFPKDVYY